MNETWLREAIDRQRAGLSRRLRAPLARAAARCAVVWDEGRDQLDRCLHQSLMQLSPCNLLYAVDTLGVQVSSNLSPGGVDPGACGQNLFDRPYIPSAAAREDFLLSEVYVSRVTSRPCVTAVQAVTRMGQGVVGYLAADFALRDLRQSPSPAIGESGPRQIKGDPAIRAGVFSQRRIDSDMDRSMPEVMGTVDELLGERGVFHAKLHFSSSRATLWLTDDPYRYRVHVLKEIVDPSVCLAYPLRPYPELAVVPRSDISAVFDRLALLRNLDETIYLRSGSLNLINGMVGLTFSCDGTYYLRAEEFLAKDERFWLGA